MFLRPYKSNISTLVSLCRCYRGWFHARILRSLLQPFCDHRRYILYPLFKTSTQSAIKQSLTSAILSPQKSKTNINLCKQCGHDKTLSNMSNVSMMRVSLYMQAIRCLVISHHYKPYNIYFFYCTVLTETDCPLCG